MKVNEVEFNIFIAEYLGQNLSAFDLAKKAFKYFQDKTCESCKHFDIAYVCCLNGWGVEKFFGCNKWEAKDEQD